MSCFSGSLRTRSRLVLTGSSWLVVALVVICCCFSLLPGVMEFWVRKRVCFSVVIFKARYY